VPFTIRKVNGYGCRGMQTLTASKQIEEVFSFEPALIVLPIVKFAVNISC